MPSDTLIPAGIDDSCPIDCNSCCCHNEVCECVDEREPGPFDDDGDQDFLFEIARDRRYFA